MRLYAAADAMVEMNPEKIIAPNWEQRLGEASVSYAGEEVTTAEGIVPELCLPTLPPKGVCGSVPILPLLHGFTRLCVAEPRRVRKDWREVEKRWAKPRACMARNADLEVFWIELLDRGLIRRFSRDEIWMFEGEEVRNGFFAVGKPTSPEKKILIAGVPRDRQRSIINLIPSNSLQYRIEGDSDVLPSAGQGRLPAWGLRSVLGPLAINKVAEVERNDSPAAGRGGGRALLGPRGRPPPVLATASEGGMPFGHLKYGSSYKDELPLSSQEGHDTWHDYG